MPNLKEKVALITGSSSGIGEATAVLFAKHGCFVSLTGRNEGNLQKVQQKCIDVGLTTDQVIYTVGDLEEESFLQRLVDETIRYFGRLDILINNAGMLTSYSPIEQADVNTYKRVMAVNTTAPVLLTRHCIPHLIKTQGTIVNVSSISAFKPFTGLAFYCMSKAALDSFTQCIALELAPYKVRVNSVNPGGVDTPMTQKSFKSDAEKEQFIEHSTKQLKILKLISRPDEIASCILFLASDDASFVTGTLLKVDGGLTLPPVMQTLQ